jgi:hypothetical protein
MAEGIIRVWRSPDGQALRYQCDPESEIFEVNSIDLGERLVIGVPADWKELA